MADKKQDLHELFRDALKNEDPNETYRIYTMTSLNYETFKTDEWNRKEQGQPTDRRGGLNPMLSRIWSEGNVSTRSIANANEAASKQVPVQRKKSICPCLGGSIPPDYDDTDDTGHIVPSASTRSRGEEFIMCSSRNIKSNNTGSTSTIGVLEEDIHPSTPMQIHEKPADVIKGRKWLHMPKSYTNPKVAVTAVAGFLNNHLNLRPSEVRQFGDDNHSIMSGSESQTGTNISEVVDNNFTTPLHEACRMGSAKLVKTFLMRGGDPNVRDGMRRSALHCTCGGLSTKDEQYIAKAHYGMLQSEDSGNNHNSSQIRQQKARVPAAVGIRNDDAQRLAEEEEERLALLMEHNGRKMKKMPAWACRMNLVSSRNLPSDAEVEDHHIIVISELEELESESRDKDRMECILTLLSWDDRKSNSGHENNVNSSMSPPPSSSSSISTSINAVDARGRTALHYAAELGRDNLCAALLSNQSAILTVIDDGGTTPCELAAANSHDELAARLEARAVLLGDDDGGNVYSFSALWGVEDENGGAILPITLREDHELVPPFSWFTTHYDFQSVEEERRHRINSASEKLSRFLFQEFIIPTAYDNTTCVGIGGGRAAGSHKNEGIQTQDEIAANDDAYLHFVESIKALKKKYGNTLDSSFPKYFSSVQVAQLLDHFGWNVRMATTQFSRDPKTVLTDAKMVIKRLPRSVHNGAKSNNVEDIKTCPICFDDFASEDPEWFQLKECKHGFCSNCLSGYISSSSESRSGLRIICPDHRCKMLISEKNLKALVTNNAVYEQMVASENENFVSAAKDFKFCPRPGCNGIVMQTVAKLKLAELYEEESIQCLPAFCTRVDGSDFLNVQAKQGYDGVKDNDYFSKVEKQPLKAHRFCFTCGKAPHWPASCSDMEIWREKVAQETGTVANEGDGSFEEVAQNLWLKVNTRSCPKCKAPIEKNDGCNHMTCNNRRCRHEFCWICGQDWRLHGSRTGGYFRCNKYTPESEGNGEESKTSSSRLRSDLQGTSQQNARQTRKAAKAMARFLHHFSRFNAHKESSDLERNMSLCVCTRLKPVIQAAKDDGMVSQTNNDEWNGLSFIHGAFCELLECRSLLQHSYVFAFRRYRHSSNVSFSILARTEKMGFEVLQSELEMVTEHLSDIVGRSHIRATRNQIRFLTSAAADKRCDVYHFVLKALRDDGALRERIKKHNEVVASRVAREEEEQKVEAQEHNELGRENDRESEIMDVLSRIQESNETNEAMRQSRVFSGLGLDLPGGAANRPDALVEESSIVYEDQEEQQQFEEMDQAILERAIQESLITRNQEMDDARNSNHSQHTSSDGIPDQYRQDALQSSSGFSDGDAQHNFAVEVVPEEVHSNFSASEGCSSGHDYERDRRVNTTVMDVWYCKLCTFQNHNDATSCSMCGTKR